MRLIPRCSPYTLSSTLSQFHLWFYYRFIVPCYSCHFFEFTPVSYHIHIYIFDSIIALIYLHFWMLPSRRAFCCCRLWSRFWICAVATAWLGLAFGNPWRFPCYLRFAKPRYTERNLRWQWRLTFHTFHIARSCLLEGPPRKYISHIAPGFPYGILIALIYIGHQTFELFFLFFISIRITRLSCTTTFFTLWRRCFPSGFHQSPRLHSTCYLHFPTLA